MPAGELIFANVLDVRQRAAEGDTANGLVYLLGLPARALPFAVIRDWKTPTGHLSEEVQLVAPSGVVTYRLGPVARFFYGSMDLTRFEDVVEDALFEEAGTYLASFVLDGEVLGQTEFQVVPVEASLEEQTIPGLPDSSDLVVITRRKYRDTSLGRFRAAARMLEGPEWDDAAKLLADRRRDRHGPPEDAIKRWKGSCGIAELTPLVPA